MNIIFSIYYQFGITTNDCYGLIFNKNTLIFPKRQAITGFRLNIVEKISLGRIMRMRQHKPTKWPARRVIDR